MKKILIASILVIGLAAGFAYAHNSGYGMGYGHHGGHMMNGGYGMMGPAMMNSYRGNGGYGDCPGWGYFREGGWNSQAHQKYLDDTAGLRKEMNDKRFEYAEAQRSSSTTQAQLAEIEKQIIDIRTKLEEKAEQY